MAQTAQALDMMDNPDWMAGTDPQAQDNPWSLDSIVSSHRWTPVRAVIYGVPGVGKTTFAATFPAPILIRVEDGANALDIPTFPQQVQTLQHLEAAVNALLGSQHPFKTAIIDSLDWLEPIAQNYICQKNAKENIEAFGYGKGYIILDDTYRRITRKLDKLIANGINVLCISHAQAVTFDPPDADPYVTYSLKLQKRAAAIWTEWADSVFFLNFHKNIVPGKGDKPGKALGDGGRVVYCASRPAYTAKTRWPMPDEIYIGQDTTWKAFHEALQEASGGLYQPAKVTA